MKRSEALRARIEEQLIGTEVRVVDRSSTHVVASEFFLDGVGGLFWFTTAPGEGHFEVKDGGAYIPLGPDLKEALAFFLGKR